MNEGMQPNRQINLVSSTNAPDPLILSPAADRRLLSLDVIRGFAILGIVLLNIYAFALPPDLMLRLSWDQGQYSMAELWRYQLDHWLFRGRFLTLFALLFGVSLYLLAQRSLPGLQRRLHWLMLIGVGHGLFWWFGDILFCYGLTGWLLLRRGYLQLPVARLWQLGHRLFAVALLAPLFIVVFWLLEPAALADKVLTADELLAERLLWTGAYWPQVQQQGWLLLQNGLSYLLTQGWLVAALMLYGVALYRSGWFEHGFSAARSWMLFVLSSLLSLVSGFGLYYTDYKYSALVLNPLDLLAMLLMALCYGSVLIKLSQRDARWLEPLLQALARCGRLAFSLYLLQSLLLVLLFRYIKPDWFVALDNLQMTAVALVMIAFQLWLSRWYLQRYQQGPLEYLWRRLSQVPNQNFGQTKET